MSVEGKVMIDLPDQAGDAVRICYLQPGDIIRLLKGKTPDEALHIISALFGICRTAQTHAAVMALEAALDITIPQRTAAARQALTAMETLREQVLRIALDWPRLAESEVTSTEAIRAVTQFVPQLAAALFGAGPAFDIGRDGVDYDQERALEIVDEADALLVREIFGETLHGWLARRGQDALLDWAARAPTLAAKMMMHLNAKGWLETAKLDIISIPDLPDEALAAWFEGGTEFPITSKTGTPETTPYSRRAADPLIAGLGPLCLGTRFAARLVELAQIPGEIRSLLSGSTQTTYGRRIGDGLGIGAIEAARGLLIHGVRLEGGRISAYRMLSPTRWNFDENGVATRCLTQIDIEDPVDKLSLAHLIVNAIDPCVAYEVRMQ